MKSSPRLQLPLFVVALSLLSTLTLRTVAQTPTPTPTPSILTSQQLGQGIGNYAIIPPASSGLNPADDKTVTGKDDSTGNTTGGNAPQLGGGFGKRALQRDRNAPRRENTQAIKLVKHVNALLNGFEQGAGFGFGIELTTADLLPGIEFRAKALTSTRFYRRFELQAYVPKLGSENTHLDIWFNYQKRTRDNFFGIGPRTPEDPETNFASDQRSYNAVLSHDFAKGIQAGVYAQVANTDAYRGEDDQDAPVDTLFSGRPNVTPITRFLPGLNVNAKLFSYGVFVEVDKRNNERGLPKGGYVYARGASFDGLENDIFDDFGWNEIELDGRVYIPLGSDFTSLALRAYTELKDPKRGSQIPFYDQAYYGGRSHGRGFRNFRFRGNNVLLLAVEPRQTVWKQSETKGVDVFAFGEGGQVWGDNRSRTNPLVLANDKFASENWRFGIGGGVQYRWNKSTAVRVELGHSNETNMVFFSVSRGF